MLGPPKLQRMPRRSYTLKHIFILENCNNDEHFNLYCSKEHFKNKIQLYEINDSDHQYQDDDDDVDDDLSTFAVVGSSGHIPNAFSCRSTAQFARPLMIITIMMNMIMMTMMRMMRMAITWHDR